MLTLKNTMMFHPWKEQGLSFRAIETVKVFKKLLLARPASGSSIFRTSLRSEGSSSAESVASALSIAR